MKITKSISTLKLKRQVVISEGNCPIPETLIYVFLRSCGSSLGRLTNSTCMWMLFCCMFIKLFKSKMSRSCLTNTSPQHQELHEDVESWIEPGAQADTGDACFSRTSHSHQHEEQDSTVCHAHRRPAQLRLLHECNTEAYPYDCRYQRRANGYSWWCTDCPT